MEVRTDDLVKTMVGAAILAGAYRREIKRDPRLKAGFGRLADKHSARAATLAGEICANLGLGGPGSQHARTRG